MKRPRLKPAAVPARILVVDDDTTLLNMLGQGLKMMGHEVTLCASVEEALQVLRRQDTDVEVLLTDIKMPGRSGIELLQELQNEDDAMVRLIMTGLATVDNAVDSLRHGAYDFIRKPVSMYELAATIDRGIEHRHLVLENRNYQNHLEKMVQQKTAELTQTLQSVNRSYEFTIEAMIRLLDAREQDSGRHSVRVRDLAMILGRKVGLTEDELQMLNYAALLHDIGKIGVPDAVLRKQGPLDSEERVIIEKHVDIGYQILKSASWFQGVAEIVHSHHECYDGTGYPRGLRGKDICIGARVFSVVDAYDAMRSPRVYRDALPRDVTVAELRGKSGTQFDPDVITAFLGCRQEMEHVLTASLDAATTMDSILSTSSDPDVP